MLIVAGTPVAAQAQDTLQNDTLPYTSSERPTFQQAYRFGDPFSNGAYRSPFFLQDPSELDLRVQFNPDTAAEDAGITYSLFENIGGLSYKPAMFMRFEDFDRYTDTQLNKTYFKDRAAGLDGESAVSGRNLIPRLYISPVFDRLFGGSYVDIQPNGFVNLDFGGRFQRVDNPQFTRRQQRNGAFNFNQQISMSVVGKVGEKLAITANFDNNNTFDFQNNLRIEYTGYDEEIIKKIEVGNVSMPISNSLMTGAQSLFGLKTELQFGKLFVTTLFSQQRSRSETLTIENGRQGREFQVQGSEYDENRHFFLGHFFRDNYEAWLSTAPQITSGVNIRRLEVYVLNLNNETQTTRNIVGFVDLGEGTRILRPTEPNVGPGLGGATRNEANRLFQNLRPVSFNGVEDFIQSTFPQFDGSQDYYAGSIARRLSETEYTLKDDLGYLSLTRTLGSNEILAVAYEYSYNGQTYKVGELTEDYQGRSDDQVIYLKLLRPDRIDTELPTWDLMMKNVYNLRTRTSQISQDGFELRIIYRDDTQGQDNPFLPEGRALKDIQLLQVFGLDRLNPTNDRQPDGNFDFIEDVTINTRTGNIFFPVLEPFGATLESKFEVPEENDLIEKYVYNDLYEENKTIAELNANQNKFVITGKVTGSASCEYALTGINVDPESVVVTAGGQVLNEGTHYTVTNFGNVIVSDEICASGKTINISFEQADLFSFQTRTLTGARFDYRANENFNIGATVLHLNERTGGISRFAVGNEPTKNTQYGLDINYQGESRFLTKMVDALPMISTKEPSTISFNAEFAQLVPGSSNVVNGQATSYIEDFEAAITPINISGWQSWRLAATPAEFAESDTRDLENRYRAAKIAWYTVDNSIFYNGSNIQPSNIDDQDALNEYERAVLPQEIFPQRDPNLVNFNEPLFDIAFFPEERGQYNYNPAAYLDAASGQELLPNPEQNWGGITRPILTETNFQENNVEYIEFWLLDPFIPGANGVIKDGRLNSNQTEESGRIIFNLGNLSEDIARDNQNAFENGLPIGEEPITLNSPWGQVSENIPLTNFFENTEAARARQDVGLDGLSDQDESAILANKGVSLGFQSEDISADNFRHVLDPIYDDLDAEIVERYKNWNGMENNSPLASSENQAFIPSSTTIPDREDINENDRVDFENNYFEYAIELERGVNPTGGNLVNNRYINDQITERGPSGDATWYQFRIPLQEFTGRVGSPTLTDIKLIRMYLTGWSQPVVLRMAQMRLVGSQWRKYTGAGVGESGLSELPNTDQTDFDISVVSIEENSTGDNGGIRYVLPPGLDRDIDNTTVQNRRFNEQSIQLCVEDLSDKDGRAVLKNYIGNQRIDLISYGRMKMFFHIESYEDRPLLDGDINGFLRLATDDNNYYEIELPLTVTPNDLSGDASNEDLRRLVWPLENEIDVDLDELVDIKAARNNAGIDIESVYEVRSADEKYTFKVKGNPDASAIVQLILGARNPEDAIGAPKSFCLWANELRVTDFDSEAGWAANARLSTKLADLGTIAASTRYTSIGFGGIQQKISERTREETTQYDISATLNIEKFLKPEKTGLVIPMYASYEKTVQTPQFDPLDPDVPLETALKKFDTAEESDRYKKLVEDRSTVRSINFTNVRKQKVKQNAKKHIYDIENFSFSYLYSDRITSNYTTQRLLNKTTSGSVNYNFAPRGLSIQPLKNVGFLKSPYFALLKDFNFSLFPSNFSFSANLNRNFRSTTYLDSELQPLDPIYERLFTFVRNYSFRWDLTKSLGLSYNATANAVIDEPENDQSPIEGDIDTRAERQFIWDQIVGLGRLKNFNQDLSLTYKLPFSKFPLTDWISSDARYAVGYSWVAGAIENGGSDQFVVNPLDSTQQIDLFFGNTIQNQRTAALNAKVDFKRLYNKATFLKKANRRPRRGEKASVGHQILRFLMMVQSVNGSYTINESTALPGFKSEPFLLGMESGFGAPGYEFILGSQDPGIRRKAAENGWLIENEDLNSPFVQSYAADLDLRAEVSPINKLSIQVTLNRGFSNQYQEIYRFDGISSYEGLTPTRSGNFSTSFLSIATAFEGNDPKASAAFTSFEDNITTVQRRLNDLRLSENPNDTIRYEAISQDVLVPAFIAAYSGANAETVELTPFPRTPLPNWRLDYTGLTSIEALSDVFSSFVVSHGYNSSYDVSSFTNSLNYGEDLIGLNNSLLDYPLADTTNSGNGELVPVYILNQVIISEQFVPLIGFNIRTKSNLSSRIEFKRSRTLSLNLSNSQIAETSTRDITLDFGYSKKGLKLPWRWQGRTLTLENDVTFRVAGSWRDSYTVQRIIGEEALITNGNRTFQLRPSVTYKINKQLDFSFYFDRNVNTPKTSNQYRRATSAFGIQLRFGLSQ